MSRFRVAASIVIEDIKRKNEEAAIGLWSISDEGKTSAKIRTFKDLADITVEALQEVKDDQPDLWGKEGAESSDDEALTTRQKIIGHVKDFIEHSSIHGFPYIFDQRHPIRRILWLFITVLAFAYSIEKIYESTVHYTRYPFRTARRRQYVDELDFPAVSFCNMNDMRLSVVNGTVIDKAILNSNKEKSASHSVSGDDYSIVQRAAQHQLSDMLVQCIFDGEECFVENFTEFFWKEGDRCFTFNSGKEGQKVRTVTGMGVQRSLMMTINVQHYEYYRDSQTAGIHLILHGQHETPVKIRGEMIPTGFTTYIQLEKQKMKNLKAPYKTQCGAIKLKYFEEYSMNTCWLEQLTDYVTEICQCKDFFMPGDISVCNMSMLMNCTWPKWEEFDSNKMHNCPLPCEIDTYHAKIVSRALFPSQQYSKELRGKLSKMAHMESVLKNVKDNKRFMRDNLLRVIIYYEDLSYEFVEQKPSYDTLEWLGDIGGYFSLFVGVSTITYFKVIDCIALVIYTRYFEKNEKSGEQEGLR